MHESDTYRICLLHNDKLKPKKYKNKQLYMFKGILRLIFKYNKHYKTNIVTVIRVNVIC